MIRLLKASPKNWPTTKLVAFPPLSAHHSNPTAFHYCTSSVVSNRRHPFTFSIPASAFPETMAFRHVIADLMGLNIIDVSSPVSKAGQRDESGKFFFVNNPDHCCYLNKVLPMEPVIAQHDVWINGVRGIRLSSGQHCRKKSRWQMERCVTIRCWTGLQR